MYFSILPVSPCTHIFTPPSPTKPCSPYNLIALGVDLIIDSNLGSQILLTAARKLFAAKQHDLRPIVSFAAFLSISIYIYKAASLAKSLAKFSYEGMDEESR